jgi:hypothetical protein
MKTICLCLFMLSVSWQLVAQEIEKIEIPKGVVYKYCAPGIYENAKTLVNKELSDTPEYSFCGQMMIIGPVLWTRFGKIKELNDIEKGNTIIQVDGKQLPAKMVQSLDDSKKVWDALRQEISGKEYALRKAKPNELIYYWSVISFDIEEPLLIIDTKEHRYILDFRGETMELFWLDEVPF